MATVEDSENFPQKHPESGLMCVHHASTTPPARLGYYDANNEGLEIKRSCLHVWRFNLFRIWVRPSRFLLGMLMPKLCHFAMLCNSQQEGG